MEWYFPHYDILEDAVTGYRIILIAGDWLSPWEVKPIVPPDLSNHDKARYLRLGLDFAKSNSDVLA